MAFTPLPSLIGGLMLSLSTSSLAALEGSVLGISGIAHTTVSDNLRPREAGKKQPAGAGWKAACFVGLLAGGALLTVFKSPLEVLLGGSVFDAPAPVSLARIAFAGFAVGLGTKLGNGCTSGHMLCGLGRLSYRSLIATLSFFSVALLTAQSFPAVLPPLSTSTPSLSLSTILLLQLPFLLYTTLPPFLPRHLAKPLTTFLIGIHFSLGLALAGMTKPSKVLGFFYLPFPLLPMAAERAWDPSLAMVAIGGLLPNILAWRVLKNWRSPVFADSWAMPTRRDIDWKLVGGSALFGLGWGLQGLCPGPLLATLGSGTALGVTAPFFVAFVAGGAVGNLV